MVFFLFSNDDDDDDDDDDEDEDEVIETFRLELSESIEVWDGEDWKVWMTWIVWKTINLKMVCALNWTSPIQSGVKI